MMRLLGCTQLQGFHFGRPEILRAVSLPEHLFRPRSEKRAQAS
jgi:EAL domain-containing protein (putative c-di-GMP-specific phosphodiesterase class I)